MLMLFASKAPSDDHAIAEETRETDQHHITVSPAVEEDAFEENIDHGESCQPWICARCLQKNDYQTRKQKSTIVRNWIEGWDLLSLADVKFSFNIVIFIYFIELRESFPLNWSWFTAKVCVSAYTVSVWRALSTGSNIGEIGVIQSFLYIFKWVQ